MFNKNNLLKVSQILKGRLHIKMVPIHLKGKVVMGKRWVADENLDMPEKSTTESLKEAKKVPKEDRNAIIRSQDGGVVLNHEQYLNHVSSALGIYKDESNQFHVKLNNGDNREAHNLWFLLTYLTGGLNKLNKVGESEDFDYNSYRPYDINLVKKAENKNAISDSKLSEILEDNYLDDVCKLDRNTFAVVSNNPFFELKGEELANSKKMFDGLTESKCKKIMEHWEDLSDIAELDFSTKLKIERYKRKGIGKAKDIVKHLVNTDQMGFLDKQGIVPKVADDIETPEVEYTLSPNSDFDYKGSEARSISLLLSEKLNQILSKEKNPDEFLKDSINKSSKFKMSKEEYDRVKNLFMKKFVEYNINRGGKPEKAVDYANIYAKDRYGYDIEEFHNMFSYSGYELNKNSVSIYDLDDIDSYKKDIKAISLEVKPDELKKKLQKELMTTKDKNRIAEIKESLSKLK